MRTRMLLMVALALVLLMVNVIPVLAAPQTAAAPTWHRVVRGETLFSIGRHYNVSPWAIARANELANWNRIYVGQQLYIPAGPSYPNRPVCGVYHIVQRGENLFRIGQHYGVDAWRIAAANQLYNLNYIRTGQSLYIPCP